MSKLFIFSIGGSGSRVIRALNMLLACGVPQFKGGDQIFPIMIDYDVKNGDTERTFKCVETYHNLHKLCYPKELAANTPTDGLFFHTPMMEMKDLSEAMTSEFTMQFRHNPNEKTFRDAIGYDDLKNDKALTQDLLKTLYDVSNDTDTELGIDMTVGFKGNPNIGSVVFTNLRGSDEFKDFVSAYQVAADDKVILIGSLFGGTGSSGIPEMVKAIRENDQLGNAVKLGVIMILPYFGFDAAKETGSVKSGLFDSKTRASLAFYEASGLNDKINSIYYVGDKERTKLAYSLGGSTQKNDGHIVDLIAAISILHFVNNVSPTMGVKYKYRMHDTARDHEPGFTILNFYKSEVNQFIKPLVVMAFAIKFFESQIARKTKEVTERAYDKAFGLTSYIVDGKVIKPQAAANGSEDALERAQLHAALYYFQEFCDQFITWVEELKKTGNHKLVMFDFSQPIEALVQDCKLSIMSKGFISGSSESNLVKPLDFSEEIQRVYHKRYENAAPVGKPMHFTQTTAAFAFFDCLRNGIIGILNKEKIAKKLNLI